MCQLHNSVSVAYVKIGERYADKEQKAERLRYSGR